MRWRIAVSMAVVVLLVILAQATALLVMFEDKEEEFIDEILTQQIAHSMQLWRSAPETAFPNTPDMRLYRIPLDKVPADVPEKYRQLPIGNHEIHEGRHEFHVAVRADDTARYVLIYDVQEHEDRIGDLKIILVTSAIPLALTTLLVGFALSGRLAIQLEQLASRVARGRDGSHVQPGMERELLDIARALDTAEARQAELLDRERDLTANIAHELRTPLTGIRTDAELLSALPDVSEAAQRRAQRIIDSVDRISRLSTSLLVLAREAQPTLVEPLQLRAAIDAVIADVGGGAGSVLNEVPHDVQVVADAALLDLVLRNLLDNAVRHAAGSPVSCRMANSVLEVHDSGLGFAAEELPHVFDRFYRGVGGQHGLGLALVRHVCNACGWQVAAANHPAGGAVISVELGGSMTTS